MSRHYSLDSIVIRGRRVFGWGFCLDTQSPIQVRCLRVPLQGGGSYDLDVLPSGHRADLAEAFPDAPHAAASGFMVHGRLPSLPARGDAALVLDRTGEKLPLPRFPDAFTPATDVPVHRGWTRMRGLARRRGWPAAAIAALRGLGRRMRLFAQPELPTAVRAARGAIVVIDHGMGGGANRYREERVARLRSAGVVVVQVESELSSLSYRVRVTPPRGDDVVELRLESFDALLGFIEAIEARGIEVNDLVGYEDAPALLERLLLLKRRDPTLRLRFNLHDFHAACPSFTLIDAGGEHCGIPSIEVCRRCLPANARHSLGMHTGIVVEEWRRAWSTFLDAADERVAFSRSSLQMLVRAFPDQGDAAWRIEPHFVDASEFRAVGPTLAEPFNVVAVGHLNHAKGASLVAELARRALERRLPLRFTVIGTLQGEVQAEAVRVTGPFERTRLCDLLEAEQASIAFVPSICPETYSYVTDELMATGLPLVVLDVGAPAERVARYHAGAVLPRTGVDAQLDALLHFARGLRLAN